MLVCQESEQEIEDEVDIVMGSDIVAATMPTKNITFCRSRSGWVFRENKTVSGAVNALRFAFEN